MNQTSRVLLALVVFLSMGCRKLAVNVGDATDAGPDSAAGGAGGGDTGPTAGAGGGDTGPTAGTGGGPGPTAGTGGAGTSGTSTGWTPSEVLEAAQRKIDILFVIDNSRSMDPKQQALAKNFPKMIGALEQLQDGLPDIHVGVVSSDMGAGGGEANVGCEGQLGNQGILWGNDPNADPSVDRNKYATVKNKPNGCGMNSGARWIEDIRNIDGITRDKNYQGKLTDVFSCLATAVGASGCGYEHQLQSLRLALRWQDNANPQNNGFLRNDAFLAIVIISDEDDCSAEPDWRKNDKMFVSSFSKSTGSLRCAARGHVCNGQNIPNFDPETGYTGTAPFEANLSDCAAKDVVRQPPDPMDPSGVDPTYAQLPLIRVQEMIDTVKALKPRPSEQILVSGIIGWPQDNKLDGFKYRIDKDPTAPKAQRDSWDYMPLCSIPELTSGEGDDKDIYKAYAGFRLKKFIDAFGDKGVFSLCDPNNFEAAMTQIGNAIVKKLTPGCMPYPLVDANPNVPEVQPECQVMDKIPCEESAENKFCIKGYQEVPLNQCVDASGNTLPPSKSRKDFQSGIPDDEAHRPCWYLTYDKDEVTGCPAAFKNQKIAALRRGNGSATPGTLLNMRCLACASPTDPLCASQ